MKALKPHRFAELLPLMTSAEWEALLEDIRVNGQRDPIVLYQGQILDGRNRWRAVMKLNGKPAFTKFRGSEADALAFVKSKLMHRNLTESQKAAVAVQYLPVYQKLAISRQIKGVSAPVREGQNGKAATNAGAMFGCGTRYVEMAKHLLESDPKLFKKVFDGDKNWPLTRAIREIRRLDKSKLHKELARDEVARIKATGRAFDLAPVDCIVGLKPMKAGVVDLIFTDPPYNEGIDYGKGAKHDTRSDASYLSWCHEWLKECARVLADDGSIFVMISGRYQAAFESMLKDLKLHRRNVIAWIETFGNYTDGNFTNCWRPILYYTKSLDEFTWHGDQILIPSDRQTKHHDKRAVKAGKVPSNVWTEFPRLVDNAKERMPFFPTQLPVALVERIVRVASDPGDLVIDPFNGSGTTGEAALRHRRRYGGIDEIPRNIDFTRDRLCRVLKKMEG